MAALFATSSLVLLPLAARGGGSVDSTVVLVALVGGAIIAVLFVIGKAVVAANRAKAIYDKYGRTTLAEKIIAKTIWVGETASELRDSLGAPNDTDEKVLKTKTKVIWKYQHRGGNRYGLRITVENGVVVGWDEKL